MKESRDNREQRAERGMSLIEVMVSMVILGVVLVALGQGLTLGIRMNTESKNRLTNLGLCKRVTETVKSQIEATQAAFDEANANGAFNRSFYVDADGNEIKPSEDGTLNTASAAYKATVSVNDWTNSSGQKLTQVDSNGVTRVLVKKLDVVVLTQQSAITSNDPSKAAGSPREIKMGVEIVRPAA